MGLLDKTPRPRRQTYYQQLNALLDALAAPAYNPVMVNRLLRLRQSQQRSRTVRRGDGTDGPPASI